MGEYLLSLKQKAKTSNTNMPATKISGDRNSNKQIRQSTSQLATSLTLATTSNPNEEFFIPEFEAWFIEIAHSNGNTCLINSECLVEHVLLHLKHKFLGKEPLLEEVLIEPPEQDLSQLSTIMMHESPSGNNRSNFKRNSHKTQNNPTPKNETTWWFLDLICQETGSPLDLVNKPRREYLSKFVKGRQKFYLCKIRKNMNGTIREIITLSTNIPLEVLDKIESHVKALLEKRKRDSVTTKG